MGGKAGLFEHLSVKLSVSKMELLKVWHTSGNDMLVLSNKELMASPEPDPKGASCSFNMLRGAIPPFSAISISSAMVLYFMISFGIARSADNSSTLANMTK